MVYMGQLLEETGVVGRQTVMRWYKVGLIPRPDIVVHPSGSGRVSAWPDWVLPRCQRILQLKKEGHSLNAIKLALGHDWDQESRRWEKRRDQPTDAAPGLKSGDGKKRRKLRAQFADIVWRRIAPMLGNLAVEGGELYQRFVDNVGIDFVGQLMQMAGEGRSPVILFDGHRLYALATYEIGPYLHNRTEPTDAFVIVPLWNEVAQFAQRWGAVISNAPIYRPCDKAVVIGDGGHREREFVWISRDQTAFVDTVQKAPPRSAFEQSMALGTKRRVRQTLRSIKKPKPNP